MAPPTRTPAAKWVEQGLHALAAGGPEAVRVEVLARDLGVTKGGFYNHFADRPALLAEMLDTWESLGVDAAIEEVEADGGDARAKLRRLFEVGVSGRELVKVELAIREWARRDRAVARRLKRIDDRRMAYLRSLFGELLSDPDEIEVRALTVLALFVGVPAVGAGFGGRRRRDLHRAAFERLLV